MRASVRDCPNICTRETLAFTPGIVDLWYYAYEDTADAKLLDEHRALLTPEERDRYEKFHFDRDRRLFLATRALVRDALSKYAPVHPFEWRFGSGEHGKPRIEAPAVSPAIHFNLANTPGLVVCAVSVAHSLLGVDAERVSGQFDCEQLAASHFAPSEIQSLRALDPGEQLDRFFCYWTLKESYIKALGLGLTVALDKFAFEIEGNSIEIIFDAYPPGNVSGWRFALLDMTSDYLIAVGVDSDGVPLSLRARHIVPLRDAAGHDDRCL